MDLSPVQERLNTECIHYITYCNSLRETDFNAQDTLGSSSQRLTTDLADAVVVSKHDDAIEIEICIVLARFESSI